MIKTATRQPQTRGDVLWLQIGKLLEHLLTTEAVCEQVQHVGDPNAHAADARAATALIGIYRNSFVQYGHLIVPTLHCNLAVPDPAVVR